MCGHILNYFFASTLIQNNMYDCDAYVCKVNTIVNLIVLFAECIVSKLALNFAVSTDHCIAVRPTTAAAMIRFTDRQHSVSLLASSTAVRMVSCIPCCKIS